MSNDIQIKEEKLTDSEIRVLTEEIANTPHIVYVRPDFWQKIKVFVVRKNSEFVGVCGVVKLTNSWIKIGPLVVLSKFQDKGYGKLLVNRVLAKHHRSNIFIQSSNPALIHIIQNAGFVEISPWQLPPRMMIFLIKYIFHNFDLELLKLHFRKRVFKLHKYHYFLKKP